METLAGLVTFESTIPLFTLALDDILSIAFPPPTLPAHLRGHAKWFNFFKVGRWSSAASLAASPAAHTTVLRRFPNKNVSPGHCFPPAGEVHPGKRRAGTSGEPCLEIT
jgi:hypothetical protein